MKIAIGIICSIFGYCTGYCILWLLHLFMYKEYMAFKQIHAVGHLFLIGVSMFYTVVYIISTEDD